MKKRPIRRSERVLLDGGPQFFRRHAGVLLFCFWQQHQNSSPPCPRNLFIQPGMKMPAVEHLGEIIGDGHCFDDAVSL